MSDFSKLDWQIIGEALDFQIYYISEEAKNSPDLMVKSNYNIMKKYGVTTGYLQNLINKISRMGLSKEEVQKILE